MFEENSEFNLEAEQAFLGSIFLDNDLIKETNVRPDFIYADYRMGIHKNMFQTMLDLSKKGRPIDVVTVAERLKYSADNLSRIGGIAYIAEIASSVPDERNFEAYAQIIIEKHQQREMRNLGTKISQGLDVNSAESYLKAIQELGQVEKKRTMKDVTYDLYEKVMSNDGVIRGARSGLADLDRATNGFHRQEFVVVGARPSMGKTAFGVNVSVNAARSLDNPEGAVIGYFAAEQPDVQIGSRMVAKLGHIELEKLRLGFNSFDDTHFDPMKRDEHKFTMGLQEMRGLDITIFDKAGMDMNYIRRESRQLRKDNPDADIIITIDYLQLIRGNPIHAGNKRAAVAEISAECKLLARELDCTVIALAQLSRGVEQRQDKRPMMSDLREAGEIEQDADVIMFLYRDEYYDAETEDRNMLEVIIAKQREGATGSVKLAFMKEYGKILSIGNI